MAIIPIKPNPNFGILPFVNSTLAIPWTFEAEATGIPGFGALSIQDKIGFGVRIIALVVLLGMATLTALSMSGMFAAWQRQRRAFLEQEKKDREQAKGKGRAIDVDVDVGSLSDESVGELKTGRSAMELGTLRPLPAYTHPSHPSGLITLSLVFLGLVFRILLVIVSFAATSSTQFYGLASPTLDHDKFVSGVDWRWTLIRAQAFFDYGATTLYFMTMIAAARHFEPRLSGPRLLGCACDGVLCLGGTALWLAAWGVILSDTKPDYDRPRRFWAVIQTGTREVDVNTALMVWTLVATLYTCALLVAKVVVSIRRKHAVRPIPKLVLATFAAIAVPTLLYQAAIHMIWGIITRTDDWSERPWEFRSQWMKAISNFATHPGEMLLLVLTVWVVQKLHRLRRNTLKGTKASKV